jgi:hypothetical protein
VEQDQTAFIASGYIHSAHRTPAAPSEPEIGQEMGDGTIYAGISPDDGKPMFATAKGSSGRMDFYDAVQYVKALDVHGHQDYRVPTINELDVLYENQDKGALKGTFEQATYWSSSEGLNIFAYYQRFSDGGQNFYSKYFALYVRCVRSDPSFNH